MKVYSYELNRKGDIDNKSVVNYTKLSDAIVAKENDSDGLIMFVSDVTADIQDKVTALIGAKGMQLYPTKNRNVWVLGTAKRETVECAVE